MVCKNAYQAPMPTDSESLPSCKIAALQSRFTFGVDSEARADDMLQNHIDLFEWVVRNKVYPSFWGRRINGENALTKEEIKYLRERGCQTAALYVAPEERATEEQGVMAAMDAVGIARNLDIPDECAIFLDLDADKKVTTAFLRGYAKTLLSEGYKAGFKANTDALFGFDREYSRGLLHENELFSQCLIWATAPTLDEFNQMATSHLIRPDKWMPYAPSGITRKDIAFWQYGLDCHAIEDDDEVRVSFNLDLMIDKDELIRAMF